MEHLPRALMSEMGKYFCGTVTHLVLFCSIFVLVVVTSYHTSDTESKPASNCSLYNSELAQSLGIGRVTQQP